MSGYTILKMNTLSVTLLLMLLILQSTWVHSRCRNANWWLSFDKEGHSKCDGSTDYIRGFFRSEVGGGIYRLEEAVCCSASSPYGGSDPRVQVRHVDWWNSFNLNHHWNTCPRGFYLQGLFRTGGNHLHNIEEGRCTKPSTHPYTYGHCYDHDVTLSFDKKGVSQCNDNYFLTGLYRSGCDDLYCIEKFKCCQMAPRPDTLDSKASVKTRIMDKTMSDMALLAHYLGYGWCSGCRAPYVGEDFRRNGDTWEADKRKPCKGYKSDHRLSMNYGDWKFSIKDIRFSAPVIEELQPETIDGGTIHNNTPNPSTSAVSRTVQSVRSVTHTTTSSWRKSHELNIHINYVPPLVTGGVSGGASYSFAYETSSTTSDSTSKQQVASFTLSESQTLPPYSSVKWSMVVSKSRSSVSYTATVLVHFSAELRGFLRWGGGFNGDSTNYHYQHRGSGDRPTFNYRFGNQGVPFYEALKEQSDAIELPWLWGDMKAKNPYAQTLINYLTNENHYTFTLTGKFDDVIGRQADVHWDEVMPSRLRRSVGSTLPPSINSTADATMGSRKTVTMVSVEKPGDPAPVFPPPPEVVISDDDSYILTQNVPITENMM